jgi:hypothetical protein
MGRLPRHRLEGLIGQPMTCREAVALVIGLAGLPAIPESAWEGPGGWLPVEPPVRAYTVATLSRAGHPHVAACVDPAGSLWATTGAYGFMLQTASELGRPTGFYRRHDWPDR